MTSAAFPPILGMLEFGSKREWLVNYECYRDHAIRSVAVVESDAINATIWARRHGRIVKVNPRGHKIADHFGLGHRPCLFCHVASVERSARER